MDTRTPSADSHCMRSITVITVLALSLVGLAAPASAATFTVQVSNTQFSPPSPSGIAGDAVTWQKSASGGFHNVSSRDDMFRSGGATSEAFSFTKTFSAGSYPYRCEIHSEMTGTVRMRPRITAAPTGLPFTVRWATAATDTGTSFVVQYRVNSGDWRAWRSGTATFAGIFGADDSPVRVVAGRTYRFRARSILNGNTSGFSTLSAFTP